MTDKIAVTTTCSSEKEAERIARLLVERRLAACVQISGPMRSIYRWKGRIEESVEWRIQAKSRRDVFAALCAELRRAHSYEIPEIVAGAVVDGDADYLDWIDAELPASSGA